MHNRPALHNAMWPGLVGKGPDSEPPIDLDTMLDLTAAAEVNGARFDGVDLFLFAPHVDIDSTDDDIEAARRASRFTESGDRLRGRSRMAADRRRLGDGIGSRSQEFPDSGPQGLRDRQEAARAAASVSMASSASIPPRALSEWAKDPSGNTAKIAETFREAAIIAEGFGERLAAEGEICWGGMHSWKRMVELLEDGGPAQNPRLSGGHGAHAALHARLQRAGRSHPARELRLVRQSVLDDALRTMTRALRPWTIDFHVAQNDATVKGSGSHDKTGRHCLPRDPNGKMDIVQVAGFWMRDENGDSDPRLPAHLLGRLHVPQRSDARSRHLARHPFAR